MATGASLAVLKQSYRDANKRIQELRANINEFKSSVQTMNQNIWYGGNSANKWYNNASSIHTNNSKFADSAENLQRAYKKQIEEIERAMKTVY